jgi:hypothetical protein
MKNFVGAVFLLGAVMTHQAVACDVGAIEAWVASICDNNGCTSEPPTQALAAPKVASARCNFSTGYQGVGTPTATCRPAQLRMASDGYTCDSARCRSNSLSCAPDGGSLGNVRRVISPVYPSSKAAS